MEDHAFPHDLNPELRGQAALAIERHFLMQGLADAKRNSLKQVRRSIIAIVAYIFAAILYLWPRMTFLSFLILTILVLIPSLVSLVLSWLKIKEAKAHLYNWDRAVKSSTKNVDRYPD